MKNLLVLLSFSIVFCTISQNRKEWGIEYRQKLGFLVANRGVMGHLPNRLAMAGELSIFFNTKGRKQWHGVTGFPPLGVTFFGGSVGNNEILGRYYGAYSFIEFPFVKTKHYEFLGKLGSGIGYTSKVFDYEKNPKNVAISSHFNALICFGVKSNFIFKSNKITLGLDMTHFSNGAYQVPNIGINLPYVSLGYARTIQKTSVDSMTIPNVLPLHKWLFGITAIASVKEIFPSGGRKYPVFGINAGWRWFAKPKVGFEGSLDIISKQAIMDYKPEIEKSQWDILQVGLFMGYLLPLDQFHFTIGMGVYVKDKYQPEDPFYHRVGMRYYFKNGIHTQLILKSHWARADYFEWGVGYTFNFSKK